MPFGYSKKLPLLSLDDPGIILGRLNSFICKAGLSQKRAWKNSIRSIQKETSQLYKIIDLENPLLGSESSGIFEYEIPLESRRIDFLLLLNGVVVVIEIKGKAAPSQADIDQADAYARDLRNYHSDCENIKILPILALLRANGFLGAAGDVQIMGISDVAQFCVNIKRNRKLGPFNPIDFCNVDKYRPLPSLIKAARALFKTGNLSRIKRAAAATEPAIDEIEKIIKQTAKQKKRSLILLSGVPGAGKTLVGLQLAHAKYLDKLSVEKNGAKPTAPAVFLSGNGPLVDVLQYELRTSGGDGKAFVRGVHEYVKSFYGKKGSNPPHHVLIYDEAQRAFDSEQVAKKHQDIVLKVGALSEPELFVQFAERVPDWSVIVGLIGTGQEIHIGEEGGIIQWINAINKSTENKKWDVYLPQNLAQQLTVKPERNLTICDKLALDKSIRFHLAENLHEFVSEMLNCNFEKVKNLGEKIKTDGYHLRITRDINKAKNYLKERYAKQSDARYGIIASSKDKSLPKYGIDNSYIRTRNVRFGPWYSDPSDSPKSCCALSEVITEFGAQGLELDAALLAWGEDLILLNNKWDNSNAAGYRDSHRVVNSLQLRINSYRVLLTRGREVTVIFVPPAQHLQKTFDKLVECGFVILP